MSQARILIVDDEPQLLQLVQRYLKRFEYEVDAYSRALDALSAFQSATVAYDLVIVDLALPDMPGDKLLASMLNAKPALLMLICSGSPFSVSNLPLEVQNQVGFLQKPFAPSMLAEAVAQLLARR